MIQKNKNIRKHSILLLLSILFLIINACKSYQNISNENFAPLYSEELNTIASNITIHHKNDSITEVSMLINTSELIYIRESSNAPFYADLKIAFTIFPIPENKTLIDSITSYLHISQDSVATDFTKHSVNLKIPVKENSTLRIEVRDINKRRYEIHSAQIFKESEFSSQWFEIISNNKTIKQYYSFSPRDTALIRYTGDKKDSLKVYFYPDSFPIPSPPFSFENLKPLKLSSDSTLTPIRVDNELITFILPKKGLYFISSDPEKKHGFTLLCSRDEYPQIINAEDMIPPIRYICGKKEYKNILNNPDKKSAIDQFWLNIGNYEKRSRMLIKKYYSRVINANNLFSSHTEGWKSDRGMIYIIYGVPNIVYRDVVSETWIYGEEKNFFSITFTFRKVENKFSNNDLFLIRTPVYKDNWYRAVDIWRQ